MCGRFSLGTDSDETMNMLGAYGAFNERNNSRSQPAREVDEEEESVASGGSASRSNGNQISKLLPTLEAKTFRGRFNISPRSKSLVITRNKKDSSGKSFTLDLMGFGLIPSWVKEPAAQLMNTINARDDKIDGGVGMWKTLRSTNRCIVVCQGYFEWKKEGSAKIPHFFKRKDGKLMLLAGMWDQCFYGGNFDETRTFTIMTAEPNPQLAPYHNRMPVVLEGEDVELWLSNRSYDDRISQLIKTSTIRFEVYKVPTEVGNVRNESPDFIRPISEKKGTISSMFASSPQKSKSAPSISESTPPPRSSQNDKSPKTETEVKSEKKRKVKEEENDSDSSIEIQEVTKSSPSKKKVDKKPKVEKDSKDFFGNRK